MRVSLYGSGQVGLSVARLLRRRPGFEVEGPYSRADRMIALTSGADVVLIATTSFLVDIAEDIRTAVQHGSNVMTTSEEAAFPWHFDSGLADELDALARDRGVTILGAGINPGFAFDALVLSASGAVHEVRSIRVERTVDTSGFSATILRRLGFGFTDTEFQDGVRSGTITGHIGFPQSMRIVARKLGVTIDAIERSMEAIPADVSYSGLNWEVRPGESAGFRQRYVAVADGKPWFEARFIGHLDPVGVGLVTRDEIRLETDGPVLNMKIEPGINPQYGSSSIIANSFERIYGAPPGWITVADIPPATAVAG